MRRVASVGALVALVVFFSAQLTAEVVTNTSQEININVFVPCANDGAGEVVALSGPLHTLIISNTDDNTVSGKVHTQPQGISGEGLTTGSKYQGTGVTQASSRSLSRTVRPTRRLSTISGSSARAPGTTSCFTW